MRLSILPIKLEPWTDGTSFHQDPGTEGLLRRQQQQQPQLQHLQASNMIDGKRAIFCLNLASVSVIMAVLWPLSQASKLDNPSFLRGGLVFTEENPHTPIYANQEFYHVVRNADIKQLQTAAATNTHLLMKYGQRCAQVRARVAESEKALKLEMAKNNFTETTTTPQPTGQSPGEPLPEYIVSSQEWEIRDSAAGCHKLGGTLPEIRTSGQKEAVRTLAKANNIVLIQAGIHMSDHDDYFRYNSDNARAEKDIPFSTFVYGGDYERAYHKDTSLQGYYMKLYGLKYPALYAYPDGDFCIRIADNHDLGLKFKLICQKKPSDPQSEEVSEAFQNQTNVFLLLADHNCQRDAKGLFEGVSDTFKEIGSIVNADLWDLEQLERDFERTLDGDILEVDDYSPAIQGELPRSRRKVRQIAEIGAIATVGTVGNILYSAIKGEAPLSWFGKVAGAIFGLATEEDIRGYADQLQRHNKQIQALTFNDEELHQAIQTTNRKLDTLIGYTIATSNGMTWLNLIQDLREMIRHNIILMETALLKITSVMLASSQGKNSPYAMSQTELAQLAIHVQSTQGLALETDLSNIQMAAAVLDGQIKIFFKIPVLNEDLLYTFYSVRPLPLFTGNGTLLPELDTRHFALSKGNEEYMDLLPAEFDQCVKTPMDCTITSSTRPISGNAHCVVQTFLEHNLRCPLVEVRGQDRDVFLTYGNTTYYSVPASRTLYIQCKDYEFSHKAIRNTTRIIGQGELSVRPGCSITTESNTKWRTPTVHTGVDLEDNSRMVARLKQATQPTNVTIRLLRAADFATNVTHIIKMVKAPENLSTELMNPTENASFAVRAASFTVAILATGLMGWWLYRTIRNKTEFCWSCCPRNREGPNKDSSNNNLESITELLTYKDSTDKELRKDMANWENDEIMRLADAQVEHINELKGQTHLFRKPAFRSNDPKPIIKPGTSRVSFSS